MAASLRGAAGLLALQGIALVAGALAVIGYEVAGNEPAQMSLFVFLVVSMIVVGAGLVLIGRGLAHAGRWARSPAVLVQLLCIPVGGYLVKSNPAVGAVLIAVGALGLVLLLAPSTTRSIYAAEERATG